MDRKEFKTEMNVNWLYIPEVKSGEQRSCVKVMVCFSNLCPKKFAVAITLAVTLSVAVSLTASLMPSSKIQDS